MSSQPVRCAVTASAGFSFELTALLPGLEPLRSAPNGHPGWLPTLLVLLSTLVALACDPPPPKDGAPNLILISVDTLRPDHLGCYGGRADVSPTIDGLAAAGALFEDAMATSPWTLPSHASLLTGLYPSRHGADAAKHSIRDSVVRLSGELERAGYRTAAVVNSIYLKKWGIEADFRDFEYLREAAGDRAPSGVTPEAVRWLDGRPRERPFFLFLHYYDVHSDYASLVEYEEKFVEPYEGSADGTTRQMLLHRYKRIRITPNGAAHLARLYDAGIRQLDDQLAQLFAALHDRGLWQDTFIVLTSDHGEEFLEHGGMLHGLHQHREVLSVPLLVVGPGVHAGSRLRDPVSLVDVMPTSLSLLGLPVPEGLDGIDLTPLLSGDATGIAPRFVYTEADFTYDLETKIKARGANRTVRTKRFRLHLDTETGDTRLFDLENDPGEQVDIAGAQPDVARRLREQLEHFIAGSASGRAEAVLSETDRKQLESLGYVQ